MDTLTKDLSHAIRLYLKRPVFTLIAVLTIALGIGINTAIFSLVNGVMLRPLPFPEPERLTAIFTVLRGGDLDIFSPANFLDIQAQNTSFEAVSVFTTIPYDLSRSGNEPVAIPGANVTSDFFRVLKIQPALGRTFLPQESIPGQNNVAVLSHALWKERFQADPAVIGREITLNSESYSIIGVLPEGAEYPDQSRVWTPLAFSEEEKARRGSIYLDMIGRLKTGVPLDTARKELHAIARRLEQEYPRSNRGLGMTAIPLMDAIVGDVRTALMVLSAAVGFVLLIACANLANLLLAGIATRSREFAVRSALGASKTRILRQLLTESLLLSVAGGSLGALLASWSLPAMRTLSPDQLPRIQEITMDWRVLAFTFFISIISGLLFGLAPAFGFSRPDLQSSLKEGTRTAGGTRQTKTLGNVLIVFEVGLVLVLLTGAGLMMRSFSRLTSVNPGFDPQDRMFFQVTLPDARYPEREHKINFAQQIIERLKASPGTESIAIVTPPPFSGASEVHDVLFRIDGRPEPDPGNYPMADITRISPKYFGTMGIPLIKGRDFSEQDSGQDSLRVVIISESLAKSFFSTEDPIGKRIVLGRGPEAPVFEIVGVAGDIKHLSLNAAIRPEIYIPFFQIPFTNFAVIAKTVRGEEFLSRAKAEVASQDPYLAVRFLAPLETFIRRSTAPARANTILISSFAGLALLLAVIGLYGLIAYSASQRTQEIGIRMALGAQRFSILGLVLKSGMSLALLGTAIGIAVSIGVTRFLESLLFQVSPTDVTVLLSVSAILLLTTFIACYIPARRAAKLDPIAALRYE